MRSADTRRLISTRRALHGVAELVLAGPQYRLSGSIRLRVTPGGFGTERAPDLRVDGDQLVAGTRRLELRGHTYAEVAAAAGVEASALRDVYSDGPDVRPDEVIDIDSAAAAHLARCFAHGDQALYRFAPGAERVLWPEHFDIGSTVDDVNYGVSPGDAYFDEPYAYVGPWQPREGPFWNVSFGAAVPLGESPSVQAIVDFFERGRAAAVHDPARR